MGQLFYDRCDVYYIPSGAARSRLGNQNKAALQLFIKNVPCTYRVELEKVKNDSNDDFTLAEMTFCLFPRNVVVSERMVVRNIRNRRGDLQAAGPFFIESLVDHHTAGKLVNHRSARMRLDLSLESS